MQTIDIGEILKQLPHRYPFLLVDRVLSCDPGVSIRGLKNVTYNEPFFQGHFPGFPLMPGVLVIEALAQLSALLAFYSGFFFSSRRRHTRSVSAFLLNRSSDLY